MTLTPETFDKPETEDRKPPNKDAFISMLIRFAKCPGVRLPDIMVKCGKPLYSVDFAYDHIKPLWRGGKNEPENWQPLCDACHTVKTSIENTERAKCERKGGRKGQYARRKKNGSKWPKGRGFQKAPIGYDAWGRK